MRSTLGVWLRDVPRYVPRLWFPGGDYLAIRNRGERLEAGPGGRGYRCLWQWTSDLHAPQHLPALGRALMRRALADHPIGRAPAPATRAGSPEVSFLIGHRGLSRLPALLATLETIAGQQDAAVECWVVEQDTQPSLPGRLPAWVHYLHTPPPDPAMPYARSWAFNAAAAHARGRVLVLHDNDLLVPRDYAHHASAIAGAGYEVVNLKRFIFYLGEEHSRSLAASPHGLFAAAPVSIMQNAEGGGSIAITREAFDAIGGMDESFVGWGGEDNEFWERASTRRVWRHGFLPLVHLWHAAQAHKQNADNPTMQRYATLSALAPQERIERLRRVARGSSPGPAREAGGDA
ncbi:galactosyltransferase-related protein [Caenimonas aquaedulcis]|uniref:Galactosyltransferase C-terminal domain-containing protein n=1 Tax=Caenimonas aquaedulcis TaxID=2793270 RepID=A0A931H5Y0_9BURK|nr:galactosyltransferase-related protein [Caenimonas aquaedulcis]MBG9389067.1 hypothetical protein [Caenimonas aquaedulcis]